MVVDANRDEGLRCLNIAKTSLADHNLEKAKRFAEKANRLYPSAEAEALLKEIDQASTNGTASASSSQQQQNGNEGPAGMGNGPNLRQRGPAPAARPKKQQQQQQQQQQEAQSTAAADEDHKATPEQRQLVAHIRSRTCYYEILSIERNASDDDIKKAYRKLALKLHPDKNKARGADEAFKSVSRAFTCLSDSDKRHQYDVTGVEGMDGGGFPAGFRRARGGGGFSTGGGGMYNDIDPDEIFRMFFGGNPFGGPGIRVTRQYGGGVGLEDLFGEALFGNTVRQHQQRQRNNQHYRQQHQHQQQNDNVAGRLLSLLAPFFLIMLFNLLTRPGAPAYSLNESRQYSVAMNTAKHSIPYFVENARAFEQKYKPYTREWIKLERAIEQDWKQVMERHCYNERLMQQRYAYYGHKKKAAEMDLKSCKALEDAFNPSKVAKEKQASTTTATAA